MFLNNKCEVDFGRYNSLIVSLDLIVNTTHQNLTSLKIFANILTINSILVNIDIISGSYANGSTQPTIYSFFQDISSGYKIIENPHNRFYFPIIADTIHSIAIWLTNQNGNEFNLRGENLSIRFHLREI